MDFLGPTFNSPPPASSAGDALGMGAISERMYGSVFPGINNVVHYVRVYSALCWVVSQTYSKSESNKRTAVLAKSQAIALDKMQLLLMWYAARTPEIDRIPGKRNLAAQKELRISRPRAGKIRLLDATWYQPSITNGLDLLTRTTVQKRPVYACTRAGEKLAEAFEKLISEKPSLRNWLLDCSTDALVCDEKRLKSLSFVLDLRLLPTQLEIDAFLPVYTNPQRILGLTQAMHTVHVLNANKLPAQVDDIRVAMAAGVASNGATVTLQACRHAQLEWSVLQVRLLQRLAAETLLALAERYLRIAAAGANLDTTKSSVARDIANCVHLTKEGTDSRFGATFGKTVEVLRAMQGKSPTLQIAGIQSKDPLISLQQLKRKLRSKISNEPTTWNERAQLAIWAMAYCAVEADNLTSLDKSVGDLLVQDDDKFSLAQLKTLAKSTWDLPLVEFTERLVLRYILELHLATAISRTAQAARKGVSTNRFIFEPVDGRLEWWNDGSGRAPMQLGEAGDVLYAAMRLLANCGLMRYEPVEPLGASRFSTPFALTKAGKRWLSDNVDDWSNTK